MAVKIRLRRTGARNQPSYRIVVAESRSKRDGRFIEILGHYNPRRHDAAGEAELQINAERALYWLGVGAEPSETTRSLLRRAGILKLRHDQRHGYDISAALAGESVVAEAPVAPESADE